MKEISNKHIEKIFISGNIKNIDIGKDLTFVRVEYAKFSMDSIVGISGLIYTIDGYRDDITISFRNEKIKELIEKGWFQ